MTPAKNGTDDNSSKWKSTRNLIVFFDDFQTAKLIVHTGLFTITVYTAQQK